MLHTLLTGRVWDTIPNATTGGWHAYRLSGTWDAHQIIGFYLDMHLILYYHARYILQS